MKENYNDMLQTEKDMRDRDINEISCLIDSLEYLKDERFKRNSSSLKQRIKLNARWENYNSSLWYTHGYYDGLEETNEKRNVKTCISVLCGIIIGLIGGIIIKNK